MWVKVRSSSILSIFSDIDASSSIQDVLLEFVVDLLVCEYTINLVRFRPTDFVKALRSFEVFPNTPFSSCFWFFSNHFANCFSLIKLLRWEFPYINSSFSILRKVFWGMCRSKLFDKSLEKERYWLKEKKMILERSSITFSKRQMFSLHKITCLVLFFI